MTTEVPDPRGTSTQAAEYELLAAASAVHDVRLVALELPPGEGTLEVGDRRIAAHGVDWRPRSFSIARSAALQRIEHASQLFLDPRPHAQARLGDGPRAVAEVVERLLADAPADLIHVASAELVPAFARAGVPIAAVVAAPEPDPNDEPTAPRRTRFRKRVDERKAARLLRRALRRCAAVAVGTEADRIAMERMIGRQLPLLGRSTEALWREATENGGTEAPVRRSRPRRAGSLPPSETPRSASIVIPTANRTHLLRRALPTVVAAAARVPGTELVIVEEGAAGAAELCRELGIEATVIHEGRGAAQKRNIGTSHARGDIVLFTDDDCEVPEAWVSDHLAALADREITATFGVVTGLSRRGGYDPVELPLTHRAGALPWRVGHTSNMGIRRSALLAVGGFDERLGPGTVLGGGEDHDLMARVLGAGGVMLTGVGEPVSHSDWRADEDHVRNLRAYERGAGLWIGKAIRSQGGPAWRYVRGRLRLIRDRWLEAPEGGRREVSLHIALLARGIVTGYRLAAPGKPHRWLPERP